MKEAPHPDYSGDPVDGDMMLGDLTSDAVVEKLNAYVGAIVNEQSKIVEDTMSNLRQKLMRVGLSFGQVPMFEGNSGSFSLPLSLFGGRFGKDENTPFDEFLDDDGISHNVEGGLSLNIAYEMTKANCYEITCKIE